MNAPDVDAVIRERFSPEEENGIPFLCNITRKDLVILFAELGYTNGAEIGVAQGLNSLFLCKMIPNLKLICVDTWQVRRTGSRRYWRKKFERMEDSYNKAVFRMAPYGAKIMRMTSEDAAKIVPDGSLDFVYIDAGHYYENIKLDIVLWEPKVRIGGIVSGHDYLNTEKCQVKRAVDEYIELHNINPCYKTIDGSPVDKNSSWFWVKK